MRDFVDKLVDNLQKFLTAESEKIPASQMAGIF